MTRFGRRNTRSPAGSATMGRPDSLFPKGVSARLTEGVCQAFDVALPAKVRREVMVNAAKHPECARIQQNLNDGLETYVVRLYSDGQLTLREVAERLSLDLVAATDLLLDSGVKGNLEADDVMHAMEQFDL